MMKELNLDAIVQRSLRAAVLSLAGLALALVPVLRDGFGASSAQAADSGTQVAAADKEGSTLADLAAAMASRSSGYGDFLAGRHAERISDLASAADFMLIALENDPENRQLLQDTFMLVAADGRHVEAVRLARRQMALNPEHGPAQLVLLVDALVRDDMEAASALMAAMPTGGLNRFLNPLLESWLRVGRGELDGALEAIGPLRDNNGFAVLERLHVALMQDIAGSPEAARATYLEALEAAAQPSLRLVWLTGNFHERQGDGTAARALYEDYLANADGSGIFDPALARIASGAQPDRAVANFRHGLAEALFNLGGLLSQERAERMALLHVHLALRLKPEFEVGRILLGEILEDQERSIEAIAAYRQIDPASPFTWTARLRIAEQLDVAGRTEEAVAELQALADDWPDHYEPLFRLGNLLRGEERFDEAATAYDRAFERLGEPQPRHWTMFYFRGIALERSDQWPRAEQDFKAALELEPEQPYVMNYLAYSWVEKAQHLEEAEDMLVRAVELRPTDGFIVDSLGWVYYRLEQYDKAVVHLEKAVELRPQDPVINDHLGDAYWKVGRLQEARFQWRRALSLEPEDDLIPTIEVKIEKGLEVESHRI